MFTLTCSYSGAPGMDWHACVRFIEENQRFEYWGNYDAEEPERLVGTCEEPLDWRAAAEMLAEYGDGSIPEDALPNVEVRGVKGWQAEMLALCWTRFGEDQDRDYCPDFLSLSDSDLAALGKEYGSFISVWGEKSAFLAAYEKIIEYRHCELLYIEGLSLAELLQRFEIVPGAGMLEKLKNALSAEQERRESQIELFQHEIEAAIGEVLKDVPAPKNRSAAVAIGMKVRPLREYIYRHLREFGGVPEGTHEVDGEEVDFGRREVSVM